jgi:hypothetical protein
MQNFPANQILKKKIIFEMHQYTTLVKIDS